MLKKFEEDFGKFVGTKYAGVGSGTDATYLFKIREFKETMRLTSSNSYLSPYHIYLAGAS